MLINNQRLPVIGKIKRRLHNLHNIKHALFIFLLLYFTWLSTKRDLTYSTLNYSTERCSYPK